MSSAANKNLKLLNILSFLHSFRTFDAVLAIYFSQITGSYASAMFALSLVNLSASFFEIPTGVFSDNIGRKRTLLFHYATGAIAILLYFLAGSTALLATGAVLLGFSLAMASGAIQAYVYENLDVLGKADQFKKFEGTRRSLEKISLVAAAIAGTLIIKFYGIRIALLLTVISRILAFIVGFSLTDNRVKSKISGNIYSQLKEAWIYFTANPIIKNIGIARIILSGGGNVEFRFKTLFYKLFLPDWIISLIGVLNSTLSALVMKYTEKIVGKFGLMKSLALGESLNRIITSVLIFVKSVYTPFAMATVGSVAFGVREVASEDILQENYTSKQRATMGSLIGLGSSLFYSIMGILIGFIADGIGIQYTLLLIQIILLSSVFFYKRGLKYHTA